MTDDMLHVMQWHNGEKEYSPFSDAEMKRRQDDVRGWMARNNVDAALFTSYHCINYYSGWLYCYFGRKYGMVIDHDKATTISAGIDGGQPWRRSFGDNITYTDWRRDNFYRAVRQLTSGAKRVGIEFDHVSLDFRRQLEEALPGVEFVDAGQPSMWMRTVKSAEEQKLIRLYDLNGRILKQQEQTKAMDIFDLAPGIYFLRNDRQQGKKIVIQK